MLIDMLVASYRGCGYILDVGCGTGYGVNELSNSSIVVGVDIWREGIIYARKTYCQKSLFVLGSALNLPFRDDLFELVVSFQVIEHIEPRLVIQYLEEARRVLREDGIFIVTTPNRRLRLLPLQRPWNPDHKKEYDVGELGTLLNKVFNYFKITGLFARERVYSVEYQRVRQNSWSIYILKPVSSIIKRILPKHITEKFRRFFNRKTVTKKCDEKFNVSIEDFKLLEKELTSCIDLYATCIKKTNHNLKQEIKIYHKMHRNNLHSQLSIYSGNQ